MSAVVADAVYEFQRNKQLADRAMSELDDAQFFAQPASHVNSVAIVVKHLAGNLKSRWSDFLTSDGDKPTRNRDNEFVADEGDTRSSLMAAWEEGWRTLFATLDSLQDNDLDKTITIRGEPHTARQALLRAMTHAAYHTGQILYLVRMLAPDSTWLTIAPGQSQAHRAGYRTG